MFEVGLLRRVSYHLPIKPLNNSGAFLFKLFCILAQMKDESIPDGVLWLIVGVVFSVLCLFMINR